MFGGSGSPKGDTDAAHDAAVPASPSSGPTLDIPEETSALSDGPSASDDMGSGEKRSGQSPARATPEKIEKKRRSSSGVGSKAHSFLASAKNTLSFIPNPNSAQSAKGSDNSQTPLQKLGKQDPALSVPQGQHNNSAGESHPGPRSTFRVGVWEDKNKKCRRTMEDTHAFLYNFLQTPAPVLKLGSTGVTSDASTSAITDSQTSISEASHTSTQSITDYSSAEMIETDNGYFAIFDGHAGTFAADWCGKKLHIILEEMIRKNPNTPVPELLDQTFTNVDAQLEKLPLKNSGCTAVTAVLRWEDRIPNAQSATGSTAMAPAAAAAMKAAEETHKADEKGGESAADGAKELAQSNAAAGALASTTPSTSATDATHAKIKNSASRQRVLYTANVGDARIVLCRNGKALRLSYDHKGGDENEGKRVVNAGGLILNNRVNGVLAVTRALGDAYMKDLVTGHPYTTETVIQPDLDEFIILACDGLWDVCSDQEAVDLVRNVQDPVVASKQLVDHALARFSTDNLSCMVVRFNKVALMDTFNNASSAIGVEGDPLASAGKISEVEKIVGEAKRKVEEDGFPAIGISGSNSGKGHDPQPQDEEALKRVNMEKVVEEEPSLVEGQSPEMDPKGINSVSPKTRSTLDKGIPHEASPASVPVTSTSVTSAPS